MSWAFPEADSTLGEVEAPRVATSRTRSSGCVIRWLLMIMPRAARAEAASGLWVPKTSQRGVNEVGVGSSTSGLVGSSRLGQLPSNNGQRP